MKLRKILISILVLPFAVGCQDSTSGSPSEPGGTSTDPGQLGPVAPPAEEEMKHGLTEEQVSILRGRIQDSWKLQGLDCEDQSSDACLIVAGIRLQMDLMELGLDEQMTSEQKLGLLRDLNLKSLNIKELSRE